MIFKILFYPRDEQKKAGPLAHIVIDKEVANSHGVNVLTTEAANASEFAYQANMLIRELENLKAEADIKFKNGLAASVADNEEPPPKPFDIITQKN